jgi:hypothetical protein
VEPEDLERRRTELHRLIRLLPIPRRPVDSVSYVEPSDEAGVRASRTTWIYYARTGGGYGVGSIPERAFIESARLQSIDAVMDWVWSKIIGQFLRAYVLPRSAPATGCTPRSLRRSGPAMNTRPRSMCLGHRLASWPSWHMGARWVFRPWSPTVRTLRPPHWRHLLEGRSRGCSCHSSVQPGSCRTVPRSTRSCSGTCW